MPPRFVGNDVVDLDDPRTHDRHRDARFVARVLSAPEAAVLSAASDPHVELWRLWAAKEAAYKVASKVLGSPPVFAHAAFAVTWASEGHERRVGTVAFEGLSIPVEVSYAAPLVHALATSEGPGAPPRAATARLGTDTLEELLPLLTPREAEAVHSPASAAVRVAARAALATLLAVGEQRLEIVCDPGVTGRRPPRVLLDGHPARADVSLSHHGAWIGWVVVDQNPAGR